MLKITTYTISALALTACAMEPMDEDESTTAQSIMDPVIDDETGCPRWGCGENSPVMGPYSFWEGNLLGVPDPTTHITFLDFRMAAAPNIAYAPTLVNGSQLVATRKTWPYTQLQGAALEGGYFRIGTPSGEFKIFISKVNVKATSNVKFWVGNPDRIETYELNYTGPGITQDQLCDNPPGRDAGEAPGHIYTAPLEAVLFTGDRYDAERKRVTATTYAATNGWMTIACAGSALAKLHFNRHTTAGSDSTHQTTLLERQTLMKMYVSDVCGDGNAWTVKGTKLHWQNTYQWVKLDHMEWGFESRWGPYGAICMDTHRLGDTYVNPPPGMPKISDYCAVPACNGSVVTPTYGGGYIVSAVPFNPF